MAYKRDMNMIRDLLLEIEMLKTLAKGILKNQVEEHSGLAIEF